MKNNTTAKSHTKFTETDLVDYLASQGFSPAKIRHNDYWYHSPFRDEKTPSFKVNRKLNAWYDFGLGKGGGMIDFATRFKDCTIKEFLQSLDGNYSSVHNKNLTQNSNLFNGADSLKIIAVKPLHTLALLTYFTKRNIPIFIAEKYCVEISYEVHGKNYYSIGFKNDFGGYELRNPYCKNCSSPKGITTIKNGASKLAVFEGFFDFLSFLYLLPNESHSAWDYCILNSLSFYEKILSFSGSYEAIHLFFDNDTAGQKCSFDLLQMNDKFNDESHLYYHYKDLNEWIMKMGKTSQNQHGQLPP